jgi:hypothetical protein
MKHGFYRVESRDQKRRVVLNLANINLVETVRSDSLMVRKRVLEPAER